MVPSVPVYHCRQPSGGRHLESHSIWLTRMFQYWVKVVLDQVKASVLHESWGSHLNNIAVCLLVHLSATHQQIIV